MTLRRLFLVLLCSAALAVGATDSSLTSLRGIPVDALPGLPASVSLPPLAGSSTAGPEAMDSEALPSQESAPAVIAPEAATSSEAVIVPEALSPEAPATASVAATILEAVAFPNASTVPEALEPEVVATVLAAPSARLEVSYDLPIPKAPRFEAMATVVKALVPAAYFSKAAAPAFETAVPQAVVPQAVVPQAVVPQAVVPQAAVPQAAVSQAVVSQAVVPQAAVPQAAVPQAVVPQAVVPQAVVPQATAPDEPVFEATALVPNASAAESPVKVSASSDVSISEAAALSPFLSPAGYLFPFDREGTVPVLADNQIVAFYGNPNSKRMGILGKYSKEDLARILKEYARSYDEANGEAGVVPAFYLIYGTCWPAGEIGYLKDSLVREYIEYAQSQGILVFIDHQIGRYSVAAAMRRILPYLDYPNVHLALDPEWRTTAPMKEIGSITAEELNEAQAMMSSYMRDRSIEDTRILVVHQFSGNMIAGRERVKTNFQGVHLVHTADGFGAPALKRISYASNARAENMPLKGFKLFFKTSVPGAGYDEPLLSPPEVLSLEPRPALIIYQ